MKIHGRRRGRKLAKPVQAGTGFFLRQLPFQRRDLLLQAIDPLGEGAILVVGARPQQRHCHGRGRPARRRRGTVAIALA